MITFIDTQVQAIQSILELTLSKSASCVNLGWVSPDYMPSTIRCHFAMANNKSQQEKKQTPWNIKQNIINEINWIEKSELTHGEDN